MTHDAVKSGRLHIVLYFYRAVTRDRGSTEAREGGASLRCPERRAETVCRPFLIFLFVYSSYCYNYYYYSYYYTLVVL